MATTRGLKLRRSEIRNINHYSIHGFRIRFEVVEVEGDTPREVFVYRRHPANADTGVIEDEFLTVASFVDLAEYPINNPDPEKNLQFFRLPYVEVDVRSLKDAEDFRNTILSEVTVLIGAMNTADDLVVTEDLWIGATPTSSDSSSASQSV